MNETPAITPETLLEHQDFVRSLARSLLFDENQVDDVVQQAWVVALRKAPRQPGALRSWLAAVTRNLSRNQRRGEGRRQKHEKRVPPRDLAPSASEIAQREEIRGKVVDAVLALAEPYRSTLILRYLEESSPKEIAEKTGEPASTVRVRIKRGLELLRRRMDETSGGDRRGWMLALVPYAAAGAGAGAVVAMGSAGSLAKWGGAAAIALVLLGGWLIWENALPDSGGEVVDVIESGSESRIVGNRVEAAIATKDETVAQTGRELAEEPDDELPEAAMAGFKGRLVGPEGKPIAGGLVRIVAGDLQRKFYARLTAFGERKRATMDSSETRTDASGRFSFSGIWPKSFYVLAAGRKEQVTLRRVLDRLPSAGQTVDLGDVLLPDDPTLRGRVLMPDGKPAVDAWVWAGEFPGPGVGLARAQYFDPEAWLLDLQDRKNVRALSLSLLPRGLIDALPLAWTRTDPTGAFELSLPQDRNFVLVVHATGVEPYLRSRVRSRAGKDKDLGEIQLKRGESVTGDVVDDGGKAVAGVEVLVAPLPAMRQVPLAFAGPITQADSAGHFEVAGMPRGGQVIAAVRRGPGEPWIFSEPGRAGDELRFVLPARFDLALRIVGPRGAAIVDPRIRVFPGQAHAEEILLGMRRVAADRTQLIAQDEDGAWKLCDLPRGTLTLLVGAEGHVTRRVIYEDGKTELPLRIVLDPATAVEVTVYGANGKPVPGATLLSRRLEAAEWTRPHFDLFQQLQSSVLPIREGRTRGDGKLRIDDLPAGKVWLTARHPVHGQVSKLVHLPSSHETLVFAENCVVEGRVVATKEQLLEHPSMIHLWKVGGNDTEAMPNHPYLMVPDADGRFRFTGVEPGSYLIQVHPALSACRTLKELVTHFVELGWSNLATQRFTLGPGDHKSIVMKWPHTPKEAEEPGNCTITGTFQVDGVPAANVALLVFANYDIDQEKYAVANGRFEIKGLHPGETVLAFYRKGTVSNENLLLRTSVKLEDEKPVNLDLSVLLGGFEGRVVSAAGAPVAGAELVVNQVKRRANGSFARTGICRKLLSDDAGRFALTELPRGEYVVLASCSLGHGWTHVRNEGLQSPPFEVRIRPGYVVSGHFDPKDFKWQNKHGHSYSILLRHEETALEISGEVDDEGRFECLRVPAGTWQIVARHNLTVRTLSFYITQSAGEVRVSDHDLAGIEVRPPQR